MTPQLPTTHHPVEIGGSACERKLRLWVPLPAGSSTRAGQFDGWAPPFPQKCTAFLGQWPLQDPHHLASSH